MYYLYLYYYFFFFNDTATTEIYTLSLHDALPISEDVYPFSCSCIVRPFSPHDFGSFPEAKNQNRKKTTLKIPPLDRKSTRLNSSHANISYAVFCLKKKKNK